MSEAPQGSRSDNNDDSRSHHSVLDAIERIAGDVPRVLLRRRESDAGDAPEEGAGFAQARTSYRVLGEIARGGMGVILRSHDADLGRDVAMKVLHEELAKRPDVLHRFVEEAQIGGQLQHPGIVPVYELGLMDDERPFFTMKLVKGRTLSVLFEERADPQDGRGRLLDVFQSVCQTMAYAHARGVIHRDLKPDNVMVGAFGEVQIVDWGLAKVLDRTEPERSSPAGGSVVETVRSSPSGESSHSIVGSVMGTPAYMPPEQAAGRTEELDARSDVFALGAILCELLTGHPPYSRKSEETVVQAANAKLEDAQRRLDDCTADEELVALARACLMPAKTARPKDAGVLAEALGDYSASVEDRAQAAQIEAAEARVRASQRSRALFLTIALAVTVLSAAGGWYWLESQAAQQRAQLGHRIDEELDAASLALSERRFEDAVESGEKARAMADSGDASEDAHARVAAFLSRAETAAAAERGRVDREERNARLIARLRELSIDRHALNVTISVSALRADAHWMAFVEYGIDPMALEDEEAAQALRETGIATELIDLIDEWSTRERLARRLDRSKKLFRITSLLDDIDPFRQELRRARLNEDNAAIVELASRPEALELEPATAGALTWSLVEQDRYDLMLKVLNATQQRHPDDFFMNVGVAMTQMQLRIDYPHGPMRYLQAAHALSPDTPFVLLILGHLHHVAGDDAAAERTYDLALENARGEYEYLVSTTNGAFEAMDPDGAIYALEQIVKREPGLSFGWYELARQARQRGRMDVAARAYTEVVRLERETALYNNNAAWFFAAAAPEDLRDGELAVEAGRRATELEPENANYWNTRALAEFRVGGFEASIAAAEESIRLKGGPNVYDGWVLVMAQASLGDLESARGLAAEVENWPVPTGQQAGLLAALRAEALALLQP